MSFLGYVEASYYTMPDFSFEFHAEPSTGIALETVFTLGITY